MHRAPSPEALVAGVDELPDPALILLTGPRGAGKTRWCERLAGAGHAAGLAVAGVVSPAVLESGEKTAIDLRDLSTGRLRRLAGRPGPGIPGTAGLGWTFDAGTLEWGNAILDRSVSCDLLILDELGPLEFRAEGGLAAAFAVVASRRYRLAVVVVRHGLLEAARARWAWVTDVLEVEGVTGPAGGLIGDSVRERGRG